MTASATAASESETVLTPLMNEPLVDPKSIRYGLHAQYSQSVRVCLAACAYMRASDVCLCVVRARDWAARAREGVSACECEFCACVCARTELRA